MNDCAETIFHLIEYELWCNHRALDFLSGLRADEYHRDFGFGLRTPHRTMFHIADVMQGWSRSVGPVPEAPSWLPYREEMTLSEIRQLVVAAGEHWLASGRASDAAGLLSSRHRLNHTFHLVTHGTHHRSQLLSMVTLMGYGQPFEGGDFGGWSIR